MTKCKCKCKCTSTHWTCKTRSGNVHLPNYTFILRERFFFNCPAAINTPTSIIKSIVYKARHCNGKNLLLISICAPPVTSLRPTSWALPTPGADWGKKVDRDQWRNVVTTGPGAGYYDRP